MKCAQSILNAFLLEIRLDSGRRHRRMIDRKHQPAAGFQHAIKLPQNSAELSQMFAYQRADHCVEARVVERQSALEISKREGDAGTVASRDLQHSVGEVDSNQRGSSREPRREMPSCTAA